MTGRPRSDAERFLNEQGIADFFSVVVCREDGPLKPDPGPVQKALRLLGAQTAWMLGDTPDDVIAGRDAAVIPVGVRAPGSPLTDADVLTTHGAARVVDASADLGGLFDGLV